MSTALLRVELGEIRTGLRGVRRQAVILPEGHTQWIGVEALQAAIVDDTVVEPVVTEADVQAAWDALPESQRQLAGLPAWIALLMPILVKLIERFLRRKGISAGLSMEV